MWAQRSSKRRDKRVEDLKALMRVLNRVFTDDTVRVEFIVRGLYESMRAMFCMMFLIFLSAVDVPVAAMRSAFPRITTHPDPRLGALVTTAIVFIPVICAGDFILRAIYNFRFASIRFMGPRYEKAAQELKLLTGDNSDPPLANKASSGS
jgi:hypothetical protein